MRFERGRPPGAGGCSATREGCDGHRTAPDEDAVAPDDVQMSWCSPGPRRGNEPDVVESRRDVHEKLEPLTGVPARGRLVHRALKLAVPGDRHRPHGDRSAALDGRDAGGPVVADPM